jgi:hypothetical protein
MGNVTEFDHFAVGADLDIASWDSYPLGFLSDRLPVSAEHKLRTCGRATPTCRPSTTTSTAPWGGGGGGSWNSSPAR